MKFLSTTKAHTITELIIGVLLILASLWLFGFVNSPANEWIPHFIAGIVVVGHALVTSPALDIDTKTTVIAR